MDDTEPREEEYRAPTDRPRPERPTPDDAARTGGEVPSLETGMPDGPTTRSGGPTPEGDRDGDGSGEATMEPLGDDRYVVVPDESDPATAQAGAGDGPPDAQYAVEVTVRAGETIERRTVASADVREPFAALLAAYADAVAPESPRSRVVDVLVAEAAIDLDRQRP